MNKIKQIITTAVIIFILTIIGFWSTITAQESDVEKKTDLQKQIEEYENKLSETRTQKNTLSSQIEYMDTQIYLTQLKTQETTDKIESTKYEIETLDGWIGDLDTSLDDLSKTMLKRIVVGYKTRQASIIDIIFDSSSATDLVNKFKYYSIAQDTNKKVLLEVQEAKLNYEEQRKLREKKKKELDTLHKQLDEQKVTLDNQKDVKKKLLVETQNDEQTYQKLLAQLRAEYAAIQSIVNGSGTETELKDVKKGEVIASVIPGASCNSSGSHLHFIVQENDVVSNPLQYLKQTEINNCSGSSCGSNDGDEANATGNWEWPLSTPITMFQGYGSTWAVRNTYIGSIYSSHNGLDIKSASPEVYSTADGVVYTGSYSGSGGCALPYVKVIHNDSNVTTLYLHVYAS